MTWTILLSVRIFLVCACIYFSMQLHNSTHFVIVVAVALEVKSFNVHYCCKSDDIFGFIL